MPLIQSKKYPDNEQFVTVEEWKIMQDKGFDRRYRIVDDGDIQDTVIAKPASFSEVINVKDFTKKEPPEMTKAEIKTELDALEIDYSEKDNKETLYNKLINL